MCPKHQGRLGEGDDGALSLGTGQPDTPQKPCPAWDSESLGVSLSSMCQALQALGKEARAAKNTTAVPEGSFEVSPSWEMAAAGRVPCGGGFGNRFVHWLDRLGDFPLWLWPGTFWLWPGTFHPISQ